MLLSQAMVGSECCGEARAFLLFRHNEPERQRTMANSKSESDEAWQLTRAKEYKLEIAFNVSAIYGARLSPCGIGPSLGNVQTTTVRRALGKLQTSLDRR